MPGALHAVWAVAIAEARYARRLPRTWVFVGLGSAVVLAGYGFYFYAHGYFSSPSPAMGYFSPRFQASAINVYLLWFYLGAAAFLAFDTGTRDGRERIADVVDSRPIGNLAMLAGRLLGMLAVVWVPLLGVVVIVQLFGLVSRAVGWWLGDPVEPVAQAAFLLMDGLPILAFWIALVLLLVAAVRNRLLVVLVAAAMLGLQLWAYGAVPASLYGPLSLLSAQIGWASEIVPRFADIETVVQRGALILFATALVCVAAVATVRSDGLPVFRRLVVAAVFFAVGGLAVAWATARSLADADARKRWLAAHEDMAGAMRPDVERIAGDVVIAPGDQLELDIGITLAGPLDETGLTFSFNPGLRVERLDIDGQAVPFSHEDGLLVVRSPTAEGTTLRLAAAGVPDPRFAYLDSAVDWRERPPSNHLALLGTESALFDRRYVALMPGTAWLPMAGAHLDVPGGARDFHTVDLTVAVPPDWLVAGPGRREEVGRDDTAVRFRFHPKSAVAEVGLLAGRFERFAGAAAGVDLELLLHPEHLHNARLFADAGDALLARIEHYLTGVESLGIPYPLGALSMVEVPSRLRGYRGGWRMGTAMVFPGVMAVKELYRFSTYGTGA